MEESQEFNALDAPPQPVKPFEPKVRVVLLIQACLFLLGAGLGGVAYQAICLAFGWEPNLAISADSPDGDRWQMRLQLGMGHLFAFFASGAMTVWLFYRSITGVKPDWPDYLKTRNRPSFQMGGLTILLMAVSVPLVLYSLNINQLIPMPEIFKLLEDQTEETLKGLLQMNNIWEFLANLTIIALLPALGEELVFRGVIQQQLMRRITNPWVAITLSAVIFSAAHFQFEGFIPRVLLGMLLGWLYWQTRNFWVPVLAHFFNNGMQVAGQYLYGSKISSIDLEKDITVPWEFALVSLFMIWATARLIRRQTIVQATQ